MTQYLSEVHGKKPKQKNRQTWLIILMYTLENLLIYIPAINRWLAYLSIKSGGGTKGLSKAKSLPMTGTQTGEQWQGGWPQLS